MAAGAAGAEVRHAVTILRGICLCLAAPPLLSLLRRRHARLWRTCTEPCGLPTLPGLCAPFLGSGLDVIWCEASVIA